MGHLAIGLYDSRRASDRRNADRLVACPYHLEIPFNRRSRGRAANRASSHGTGFLYSRRARAVRANWAADWRLLRLYILGVSHRVGVLFHAIRDPTVACRV